ncbi:hypothetical protein ASD65_17610 [Microbacterium sp. Root61]|uniref:NUDIX hydrolase n=1 Tax=Microbacterium sp. Root61 TaxID=1736570 RepID=UPI0006FC2466|nr:NUDIX hydrolase [Microbacterium sp. Root61]KRA22306.1 hypothetical protein ASD65_17610 [Microbacterium sp. Root61]
MDDTTPGETNAARTFRELADALGEARPRTDADAHDPAIPVAATVILLRDTDAGPEVLLIERPDRGSFAGAWVFPGGKVEAADRIGLPADAAEETVARVAGVRETLEEVGLVLPEDALTTLSCWDPPPGAPLRIRTWFFLAPVPEGELLLQQAEAIASLWVRPSEMLARHGRGEVLLYPPTWVTLHGLSDQPDVATTLAEARLAGPASFHTAVRSGPVGPVFYWAEDAEYAADRQDEASGARHRLEAGALPWTYVRTP